MLALIINKLTNRKYEDEGTYLSTTIEQGPGHESTKRIDIELSDGLKITFSHAAGNSISAHADIDAHVCCIISVCSNPTTN